MKRELLTAAFFIGAWGAYSQVGIGTLDPNKSSQLDVSSANKGVLIPRVKLVSPTDQVTIENGNVNSLLVFNTNTAGGMEEAYYYWFENQWMKILNEKDISDVDTNTKNQSFHVENNLLVLTDTDNNFISVDISELNIVTTLTNNNDGTYNYVSENGTQTLIDVPSDVINQFSEIAGNQNVKQILEEIALNVSGNVYYDGNSFTYIDSSGTEQVIDMGTLVKANETVTTLVLNPDGTYTYTNEKKEAVIIDPYMVSVEFEDGIYKFTDHKGSELAQINTNADHIKYDNSESGLNALNVQDALDELVERIGNVNITGKDLTAGDGSIEVVDGTGATLVNSNIKVADGGITADKLGDGSVTPSKMNSDSAPLGNVATADGNGGVIFEPLPANENSWKIVGTTDSATDETSDIYHSGIAYIGTQVSGTPPVTEADVKLHVTGNIETTGKVFTTNSVYADYVFEKYFEGKSSLNEDYEFKSLEYVRDYTMQYHHLPGVTPINDLKKGAKGYQFDLTQLTIQQLEKIEELFLHIFELEQQIKQKEQEIQDIELKSERMEKRLELLEKMVK